MQSVVAYLIVAIALLYAAWLFMPQPARRWLLGRVGAVSSPSLRARLARLQSTSESTGCNSCQGCETDAKTDATVKPIRLHRR